jgi:hypothetical protein
MKRPVGPPSPNLSNGKKNGFARKKLQRTVGPPRAVNARSQRRTKKKRTKKARTARTEVTASETEIVTVVVTTATRTGKEIATATVTVNGIGTATMRVEEGSIIDEMIMTMVIDRRGTTGTGITATGRRNTTRSTTGMRGGGTASIGMTTARRRVGVRGNVLPRRSMMRGARR